jgi:outer membrane lipopolysaccharide assembly protein LptE/RlpB
MKRILFVVLAAVLLMTGCGYTTRSLLPENYKTIYVAPFENKIDYMNQDDRKIYIPGLETKVRQAVIDRYLFDGNLHIGQENVADLVLKGQLLSFDRQELRLTTSEDVKEYRLLVTVALTLIDPADNNKVVWQEPSFSGEATYYVSGPLAKSESAAIDDAVNDLAQRAVARTIENW